VLDIEYWQLFICGPLPIVELKIACGLIAHGHPGIMRYKTKQGQQAQMPIKSIE
jgi:hypothetical protein